MPLRAWDKVGLVHLGRNGKSGSEGLSIQRPYADEEPGGQEQSRIKTVNSPRSIKMLQRMSKQTGVVQHCK